MQTNHKANNTPFRSAKPTRGPTIPGTLVLSAAVSSHTNQVASDAVLIVVYVLCGLAGMWGLNRVRGWYLQVLKDNEKRKSMRTNVEATQTTVENLPQHRAGPSHEAFPFVTISHDEMTTEVFQAHHNQLCTGSVNSAATHTDFPRELPLAPLASVCSIISQNTSSVNLSSLHSSENSDDYYSRWRYEENAEDSCSFFASDSQQDDSESESIVTEDSYASDAISEDSFAPIN